MKTSREKVDLELNTLFSDDSVPSTCLLVSAESISRACVSLHSALNLNTTVTIPSRPAKYKAHKTEKCFNISSLNVYIENLKTIRNL